MSCRAGASPTVEASTAVTGMVSRLRSAQERFPCAFAGTAGAQERLRAGESADDCRPHREARRPATAITALGRPSPARR
ncbi:hypothetical protein [Micromonospora wenchangensis]|uniref:hypothetical protein n=1 Tax=Micromonospora wenchangensis TaxID=1185415 RepID=UPI003449E5FF